ncbi:MAG: 5-histidylcysteine sulfoxide synthase/putative 4-mercaptohistidine N1-methyltransferase [Desulforhopalus sp.]
MDYLYQQHETRTLGESMDLMKSRTTILNSGSAEEKREEILRYFLCTFDIDSRLYDHLTCSEAFYLRAEPLRHPLIFYYGHTASFYINKLNTAKLTETRINRSFESMFAIGVDEMSWDDLNEKNYNWPTVNDVQNYRMQVRDFIAQLIRTMPLTMPITWEDPFWAIMMGIEHQRIHLETSSVIIRRLPINLVQPLDEWEICRQTNKAPANELLSVIGGKVTQGKTKEHPLYGWDNEFGYADFDVLDFKASKYLVSNGEFLHFVNDNGYSTEKYWTTEGWQWLQYSKATMPVFWIAKTKELRLRTLSTEIDMPWDWPVEVNYLEAKAFCNWLSLEQNKPIRLPSESEWYRLYDLHNLPDQPYWDKAPGNINLEHWASPCPVDQFRFENFYDIIGNVWQWTETSISGFEGFEVHPWYDDFSVPTFDTQHNIIKGGSWISTGNAATKDSRYAFRRHFFQHAGFRYVETKQTLETNEVMYEGDDAVSQYCEAHYGRNFFKIDNFPQKCASICIDLMGDRPKNRALDLGCSVGRSSFELAKEFSFVNGLDFSARFIRIAHQMQEKGHIRYELHEEGEIISYHQQSLKELGLEATADKVEFYQGDAQNLKPQFCNYDLILAANLLDRLSKPKEFLSTIHERLNDRGYFVLCSPYTWLEEFTTKQNWVGGFRKDGEPYSTLEGICDILKNHFTMIDTPIDIDFITRETSRKFQHSISQMTLWQKR